MPPSETNILPSEEQAIPTGRFKPLVSLKYHKWLMLLIFFTMSGLGIQLAPRLAIPTYKTTAEVLVSPRFMANLDAGKGLDLSGRDDYQFYLEQQERLVVRRDVLQEALKLPKVYLNWLRPNESEEQGLARLAQSISVSSHFKKPFLTITLTSTKGEGLDIVLNGLLEVYLKKSQEENLYGSEERIKVLQQRREELLSIISQREKQRAQIGEELGVTTFQEKSLNPHDDILIENTKAYNTARRTRVEVESRFNTLTQGASGQTVLDIKIRELVASDSVLTSFKARLIDKRTELMTQILGLTPQHPGRQRIEQEISKIDQDIQEAVEKLATEIRTRLLEQGQAELLQVQRIENSLLEEIDIQRKKASHYTSRYNQALVFNKEIERAYKLLSEIDDKIDFLTIEATAPGFLRLDSLAREPQYSSKKNPIFLGFLIVAFGLAIVIPILIDLLDTRIRTPGEVHKVLGFAPMAWILDRSHKENELLASDYLYRLALALARDWRTHHTRTFVLTSVKPAGGSTTLTLELAQKLNETGVHTLALELNAFKPDSRYHHGEPWGLNTLLKPHSPPISPESLIVLGSENLPDRLPIGETSNRYIVTHGRLSGVLEQLHTHYDLILLDTPPILLSSDAELLGEVSGGVLLVIEAGQVTPGELKRAAHLLTRLHPPVVGAILNKVKVYQGGGYFADLIKEHVTGTKLQPGWIKRLLWGQ